MRNDPIVSFYLGQRPDAQGRSIEQLWKFNETQLEDLTDYMEWLFPLGDASRAQPGAPVVSAQTREAFASIPELGVRLKRSLDMMLCFYGLTRDGETVRRAESFASRHLAWLYPEDHNHPRLSRIVKSLALLGERALAEALRDELVSIADDHGAHGVSRETRGRWAHILDD